MFHRSGHRLRAASSDDAGGSASPGVLDSSALDRLRQFDPDGSRGFLAQVLDTYRRSLERQMPLIAQCRADGDWEGVGDSAHLLKSSSASVGALDFSRRCAEVERLARTGEARALDAPLCALLDEGERVLQAVRAMLPP